MTKTEKLTAWQTRTSEPNVKYRHTETDTHRLLSKNNYDEEDEYKYNYKDRAAEIRAQNEVQKHTHTHILHPHHFPIFYSRGHNRLIISHGIEEGSR